MPAKLIYIAAPLSADTEEQRLANVDAAIDAGLAVYRAGGVPLIPHLNYLVQMRRPGALTWSDCMAWDLPVLRRCDGLLRLPGESRGADVEVATAREFGMPVRTWPRPGEILWSNEADCLKTAAEFDWLRDWIASLEVTRV